MSMDAAFALSPQGLEDVFQVMCAVIPEQPFEEFTSKWSKISHCLDCTAELASAQGRFHDSRMLRRLSSLLTYGEWGATALDVSVHPKLPGFCLLPATYKVANSTWYDQWQWKQRYLAPDLNLSRKWLNVLAWHFSLKEERSREFQWCRRRAWLLREARRSLRFDRGSAVTRA